MTEQASEVPAPPQSIPQANADESAQSREEIRRRSVMPYVSSWNHGGLND